MRTKCGLCGRFEPFQSEWDSIPESDRADLCWGDPVDCGRAASAHDAAERRVAANALFTRLAVGSLVSFLSGAAVAIACFPLIFGTLQEPGPSWETVMNLAKAMKQLAIERSECLGFLVRECRPEQQGER